MISISLENCWWWSCPNLIESIFGFLNELSLMDYVFDIWEQLNLFTLFMLLAYEIMDPWRESPTSIEGEVTYVWNSSKFMSCFFLNILYFEIFSYCWMLIFSDSSNLPIFFVGLDLGSSAYNKVTLFEAGSILRV